jgi:DNA-binding SARP family transcriptional activator
VTVLEFRILGTLEVLAAGRRVPLAGPGRQALLAVLLLRANQAVGIGQLIDDLWAETPPANAEVALRMTVLRLRRWLAAGDGDGPSLLTRPGGYALQVDPDQVDAHRFGRLAAEGHQALADGDAELAGRRLREALALWRGPALAGMPASPLVTAEAARLDAARHAAVQARIDADLARGRHAEALADLETLAGAHPLDEGVHARLMRALSQVGRQADALTAYRELRRRLVDTLGVEPGPELRRLEQAVLTADLTLQPLAPGAAEPARPAPCQLPPGIDHFTGRDDDLAAVLGVLGRAAGEVAPPGEDGATMIATVNGAAGVGKSTLAVRAAHQARRWFPDGQLYVNLHGATPGLAPLPAEEALGGFLRALGVDGDALPQRLDDRAGLYRSLLAERRVLVVLDDASTEAQVLPLLPAGPGCAAVVTSRRLLAGLTGGSHVHLDVLPAGEAVTLLGRLAGERRVAAEPAAAAEAARLCGYLPLALRIAGMRLAARPAWPVEELAGRLADERRRLRELEVAGLGVRASLVVSHRELREGGDPAGHAAAGAFALLAVLDGPEVGVPVAARLLDRDEAAAEELLELLVDAQLLETPAPGRYRLHDLLRLYARELAGAELAECDRDAAVARALRLYTSTAWRALALLRPGDPRLRRADDRLAGDGLDLADAERALAWLDAERANLVAAVGQAAAAGLPGVPAAQLAHALFAFFQVRGDWDECARVNEVAMASARRAGDRGGEALAGTDLGVAHEHQGRHDRALARHQASLAAFRQLGDLDGQVATLSNLGNLRDSQGRYDDAAAHHRESLAIARASGNRHGREVGLTNLGVVYSRLERWDDALACERESLAIAVELGDRHGQAISLSNQGLYHHSRGRDDEALAAQLESLAIAADLGNRVLYAAGLCNLGLIHEGQGRDGEALACQRESLETFRELGARGAEAEMLRNLGDLHERQGRPGEALACQRESVALYRDLADRRGEAASLRALGATLLALGRREEADGHLRRALGILDQLRLPGAGEVRALLASGPGA